MSMRCNGHIVKSVSYKRVILSQGESFIYDVTTIEAREATASSLLCIA